MRILQIVGLAAAPSLFFALSFLTAEKNIKRQSCRQRSRKRPRSQQGCSDDAGGVIVELEEQVAMDSLPTDVQDGLHAKAGKGKIVTVESITKHDKLVAYEAAVLTEGQEVRRSKWILWGRT